MEPSRVSGRSDPKPIREAAWNDALSQGRMSLLSPSAVVENNTTVASLAVELPIQGETAQLKVSSTNLIASWAIDLVAISAEWASRTKVIVHNGTHCAACGCTRGWCREVGRSNHFHLKIIAAVIAVGATSGSRPLEALEKPAMPQGFRTTRLGTSCSCLGCPFWQSLVNSWRHRGRTGSIANAAFA